MKGGDLPNDVLSGMYMYITQETFWCWSLKLLGLKGRGHRKEMRKIITIIIITGLEVLLAAKSFILYSPPCAIIFLGLLIKVATEDD